MVKNLRYLHFVALAEALQQKKLQLVTSAFVLSRAVVNVDRIQVGNQRVLTFKWRRSRALERGVGVVARSFGCCSFGEIIDSDFEEF